MDMDTREQVDAAAAGEKLLPQSAEAETATLGSMLIDPEVGREVEFLRPAHFYTPQHRVIYAAMERLRQGNVPVDLITLVDDLEHRGELADVGGAAYITSLANHVPTSANVVHYARVVERMATRRALISAAGQIANVAFTEPDAHAALEQAERLIRDIARRMRRGEAQDQDIADVLDAFLDETLAGLEAGRFIGVETGFGEIDRHIFGFAPGELVLACGRPGSGKSTIAAAIAYHEARACAARGNGAVEWITLEMRAVQQAKRLVAALAEVDGRIIRAQFRRADGSIDTDNYHRVRRAVERMRVELRGRMHILDTPATLPTLRQHVRRAVYDRGCTLVVVDYIGLISSEERRSASTEYQRITDLSRQMKQIALEFNVPILCLVQMSRAAEARRNKRPLMTDLRDSGGLEQDADFILGIYRGAAYEPKRAADEMAFCQLCEISVLKAREGVSNVWFPLRFEGAYSRVSSWPANWQIPDDETREMPDADGGRR